MKGLLRSLDRRPRHRRDMVKETIVLDGKTIDITSVSTAVGFGTLVIGDFAEGNILYFGMAGTIGFAGSGSDANLVDDWEGDVSLGSTATVDVTLDTTDVDLLASTAIPAATAEVVDAFRVAEVATPIMLNNTDGSLEINLNMLIDAADIADDETVTITLSGTIELAYTVLGDD